MFLHGAADRRIGPHRRAVRGVPARSPLRLAGEHTGAGNHPGGAPPADRRHHVEPDAGDPRRREAPPPVPLGQLPRRSARAGNRPAQGARASDAPCRARWWRSCRSCAPRISSSSPVSRKPSTGRRPSPRVHARTLDPDTVNDTLGVLLSTRHDIARVQGSEAARILVRGPSRARRRPDRHAAT